MGGEGAEPGLDEGRRPGDRALRTGRRGVGFPPGCGRRQRAAGSDSRPRAGPGGRNPRKTRWRGGCRYCLTVASEASGASSAERREKFRGRVGAPPTEVGHGSLFCLQAVKKSIFLTDHRSSAIRFSLKFEVLAPLEESGLTPWACVPVGQLGPSARPFLWPQPTLQPPPCSPRPGRRAAPLRPRPPHSRCRCRHRPAWTCRPTAPSPHSVPAPGPVPRDRAGSQGPQAP